MSPLRAQKLSKKVQAIGATKDLCVVKRLVRHLGANESLTAWIFGMRCAADQQRRGRVLACVGEVSASTGAGCNWSTSPVSMRVGATAISATGDVVGTAL